MLTCPDCDKPLAANEDAACICNGKCFCPTCDSKCWRDCNCGVCRFPLSLPERMAPFLSQHERDRAEIAEIQALLDAVRAGLRNVEAERDAYRAMLCDLLASAHPHPTEHPTMAAQWARARELLKNVPGVERDAARAEVDRLRPVYEAAKEWHGARCTRMPSCDPHDGSHDAECLLAIAESHLTNALDAALAAEKGCES